VTCKTAIPHSISEGRRAVVVSIAQLFTGAPVSVAILGATGSVIAPALVRQKHVFDVAQYRGPDDRDDSAAFQRAIDACAARGGGIVNYQGRWAVFNSPVQLRSGVKIRGRGAAISTIELSSAISAGFIDNNRAIHDAGIQGLSFVGAVPADSGARIRGVWLDAQGPQKTSNFTLYDVAFRELFRGIEIDHVDRLSYDQVAGDRLTDSLIYIGELPCNRSRQIRHGRVRANRCLTSAKANGGGVVVIAYADDVICNETFISNSGPADGQINLFHGLYLRAVRWAEIKKLTVANQQRGAALHIYSDVDSNEPFGRDILSTVTSDGTTHYSGVRIDHCQRCTVRTGSIIKRSAMKGIVVTNSESTIIEAGVVQ
jgi:hypothetical protein